MRVLKSFFVRIFRKVKERFLCPSDAQMASFFRVLSLYVKAGLSLQKALECVHQGNGRKIKRLARKILGSIQAGIPFFQSLKLAWIFSDPLVVGLLSSAERFDSLNQALCASTQHLRKKVKLKGQVKRGAFYPLFLCAVLCVCLTVAYSALAPEMAGLRESGVALGSFFSFLSWLGANQTAIMFCLGSFAVAIAGICLSPKTKQWMQSWLFQLPCVPALFLHGSYAYFFQMLATGFQRSLPIEEVLGVASTSFRHVFLVDCLERAREGLRVGLDLDVVLSGLPGLPAESKPLLRATKDTQAAEDLFQDISAVCLLSAEQASQNLSTYLGPILLLVTGGLFMWAVHGLVTPLYDNLSMAGQV